ncbi:hypothetical protein, partial [Clostridium sp.]|uniref:hypothetical protein n=1 Tax=Clostridium sp. TaxID=1506 RepID=UPI002841CFEA
EQIKECNELSLNDINTSFRVVALMKKWDKLLVKEKYLEIDRNIIRWTEGVTRLDIINFLNHLLNESNRNIDNLLDNIKHNEDTNENIFTLETYVCNLIIFMDKFNIIEESYSIDSLTASKILTIKNGFEKHYSHIFDIICKKKI